MNNERKRKIKKALFTWPYSLIFILTLVIFSAINIIINDTHLFFSRIHTFTPWFSISFTIMTILIALFVALNISLVTMRINEINKGRKINTQNKTNKKIGKESKVSKKESSITGIGIFTGLLAGSCPACFAGLLPAFLGIFGLSISLSNLPLAGIELQIISLLLLIVGAIMLTKDPTCKIPTKKTETKKQRKEAN